MRRLTWTLVAMFVAAGVFLFVLAPPAPARVETARWDDLAARTVAGAYHVHTTRSDGRGDKAAVAAAAARAGLTFVMLTDHGDGTRPPDPPEYVNGVLVLDGVEISTDEGHYVALDMPRAPYPLGGAGEAVVEDVRRLGGLGIAAHPDSPKAALRWTDTRSPIDGIEWINADSEWRDESWPRLLLSLAHYPLRPAGAVASVLDAPAATLERWDRLAATQRVLAFAGADAHARLALSAADRDDETRAAGDKHRIVVPIPSYEAMFRTFSTRVLIDAALTGVAHADAVTVLDAMKAGRAYSAIDAFSSPGWFEFTARQGDDTAVMGDTIAPDRPVAWRARASAPAGSTLVLLHNGNVIKEGPAPELTHEGPAAPGSWRVEVRAPGAPGHPPTPFIVGNPVFVREKPPDLPAPAAVALSAPLTLYADGVDSANWRVEHQADSRAAIDVVKATLGLELAFRYALNTNRAVLPYAAAVRSIANEAPSTDRLTLRMRADRVMRLSVQLRSKSAPEYPRWRRSIPIDTEMRDYDLAFDSFSPVPPENRPTPDLATVDALLFVVDMVNTAPGTAGIVYLDDIRLGRATVSK